MILLAHFVEAKKIYLPDIAVGKSLAVRGSCELEWRGGLSVRRL